VFQQSRSRPQSGERFAVDERLGQKVVGASLEHFRHFQRRERRGEPEDEGAAAGKRTF